MGKCYASSNFGGKFPMRLAGEASAGCTVVFMADELPRLLIKEWRTFRGLTQEELADAMEISLGFMSKIETGQKRWNATHLLKASQALGIKPHELLTTDPYRLDPTQAAWDKLTLEERYRLIRLNRALDDPKESG